MKEHIGFETTEVESSCGRIVKCNYLQHPTFDRSQNIWQSLHYIFINYCPNVIYANVYLLRSAINALLDYVADYNSATPKALQITQYTDISTELFSGYVSYLRKNQRPPAYAEKLKSAMTVVTQNTGKLPVILLPPVKVKNDEPTEPLTDSAYNELVEALKAHVDILQQKLAFRETVHEAEPYEFQQSIEMMYPLRDRGHVFQWYQWILHTGRKAPRKSLESKFEATDDKKLLELCGTKDIAAKFRELYDLESGPYLLKEPENPFKKTGSGVSSWAPDNARTVRTLLDHGYPFKQSLDELDKKYGRVAVQGIKDCNNILKILIHRYTTGARLSFGKLPQWDGLMAMYYPTPLDMSALVIFLMLQSGWNKETVLSIDRQNFEHALTGAISESMRVVFSEKNKSQSSDKPYEDPKQITANSDKNNPYSIYNLIILAGKLSAPLTEIPFDVEIALKKGREMNDLFLCIRAWGDWNSPGGRHTSITNQKAYHTATKAFFEKYPVYENGRRLATAGDLARRLRPTWAKFKRKEDPLSLLSLRMGHADEDTTDIYYDSSGLAMQERRERLRSTLEEVMHLLRTRQFQGLLGEQASALANSKPKIFHIPGKDRPLWGCRDQKKPNWPGADRQIPRGQKCTAIDKCYSCEQVWITEDSLPFLFERLQHLEEDLADMSEESFSARLESEKEILEYLIDSWDDNDAIKAAERYQHKNSPLLPRDLASLRIIFQEEHADEYI